jgi:hypothetical protein
MPLVFDTLPLTSFPNASNAVFQFSSDFCPFLSKLGSTPYLPMPVSDVDVGRKGRRIDQDIALLLQRRDPHWWHTFDVEATRT